jgi:hypothetical protein
MFFKLEKKYLLAGVIIAHIVSSADHNQGRWPFQPASFPVALPPSPPGLILRAKELISPPYFAETSDRMKVHLEQIPEIRKQPAYHKNVICWLTLCVSSSCGDM